MLQNKKIVIREVECSFEGKDWQAMIIFSIIIKSSLNDNYFSNAAALQTFSNRQPGWSGYQARLA